MTAAAQAEKAPEIISLPSIAPGDIVAGGDIATQAPDDDRAGILARLKQRALEHSVAPVSQVLEPIIPTPPVVPTPEIPIAPITPEPIVTVAPKVVIQEAPSPIHTFRTDFQDHVKEERASSFSVLAAEKDAHVRKRTPKKRNASGVLAIAGGVILLIAGVGGIFAAYVYMSKNAPVLSIATPSSLITPDSSVVLSGSGSDLLQALAVQGSQPLANNKIVLTYVNESTTTPQGVTEEPASGGAFIAELNLQAPDILLRNIDPTSMVGIVSAGNEARPFFILQVESYERTFAGMLEWEPSMYESLSTLYPEYAASGANSTLPAAQFIDETVDSHEVRALKDNSGRTLVLYGYADKQTLIIARNEAAFTLLLNRLQAGTT
jgi:hypothetical protein